MSTRIAVLDWHQPDQAKAHTFVPFETAQLLLRRMAAESISAKVIRMMPPGSVFTPALQIMLAPVRYVPMSFPPVEVENCRFVPAASDSRPRMAAIRANWDWSHDPISA